MKKITRRTVAKGLVSAPLLAHSSGVNAQNLNADQKRNLASIYAAASPATTASTRELRQLLTIQESLIKVPNVMKDVDKYIANLPSVKTVQNNEAPVLGRLLAWHRIALDATTLDHTTSDIAGATSTFSEQFGPARSSRALAIVHLAMFEAVNTIDRKASSYKDIQLKILSKLKLDPGEVRADTASIEMAIMQAAHDALVQVYEKKRVIFDSALTVLAATIADTPAKERGAKIGAAAAEEVMLERKGDNADPGEPPAPAYDPMKPTQWAVDPVVPGSGTPLALGGNWGKVTPFVMASSNQFRPSFVPPPPGDPKFVTAYEEVRNFGGDRDIPINASPPRWRTDTKRTGKANSGLNEANETFKAIYWAYDGTPALCAPPRLYNMVATSIALKESKIVTVHAFARYLALINLSLGDAGISAWEAKYHYNYARPVTVLRNIDSGGVAGKGDPHWTPLGAQVTNGGPGARNLTPPFPAYPSGHAVFGAAMFETVRQFFGLPLSGMPFKFISDEYNGKNRGPGEAAPRPLVDRAFASFAAAEYENAQSRIWMGIHWAWDRDEGITQGRAVGKHVFQNALKLL